MADSSLESCGTALGTLVALQPPDQSCDVLGEAVGGAPGGKLSAVYVMVVRVMPFSSSFALCSWNSSSERENRLRL